MNELDLVEVFVATDVHEAQLMQAELVEAGIDCQVVGEHLENAAGALPLGHATSPRLWVFQADSVKAISIIDGYENARITRERIETPETDYEHQSREEDLPTTERQPVNWRAVFVASMLLALVGAFFIWIEFFAEPTTSARYAKRADFFYRRGQYELALRDYSFALVLDPRHPYLHAGRANAHYMLGEYRTAIDSYTAALAIDPTYPAIFAYRGYCWNVEGEYELARSDYEAAIRLGESDAETFNTLAWLLATCPDNDIRDGKNAVQFAQKACDQTQPTPWYMLETLAAANAEAGNFDTAIALQRKVIQAAPSEEKKGARDALTLYQSNSPRRD
jgi:tetratricopeptide (TPR) repeat protein